MKELRKIFILFLVLNCICFVLGLFFVGPVLQIETEIGEDTIVELYYTNNEEDNFSEQKVLRQINKGNNNIVFRLPKTRVDTLRIDFSDEAADVILYKITYKKNFFTTITLSANDIKNYIYATNNISEIKKQGDALLFETLGTDSFIIFREINSYPINFVIIAIKELLFVLISFLAIRYGEKVKAIENKLNITKKQAVVLSGLIYIITVCWFSIKYKGYFSVDEFFHISTLNPSYVTDYNRANYINYLEKIICAIFGKSDVVVKFVPILCGLLCFALCMYLAYQLYDNAYWIITVGCIITFSPYVLYNHFYIRMYIFLETVVMLDSVLLYIALMTEKKIYKYSCLIIASVITGFYCINTKDFTSAAMLLLFIAVLLYCLFGRKIESKLSNVQNSKPLVISMVILSVTVILIVIFIKKSVLDFPFLYRGILNIRLDTLLRTYYHSDDLTFLKFIFVSNFFIIIPFLVSVYNVLKKSENRKRVLFVMAILPLIGYLVLFYDTYQIRSYIAFWPIVCVLSFLVFDTYKIRKIVHLFIIVSGILLSFNVDSNFWKTPLIPNETLSMNLGQAYACAKGYEENGYEIVTMMTYETQSAYFDLLDVNINLNLNDIPKDAIYESYVDSDLKSILNGEKKYVLLMDNATRYYYYQYKSEASSHCEMIDFGVGASCVVVN